MTMGAVNPLNSELNPICHLLALLGAHHILHVSRVRVKAILYEYASVCPASSPRTFCSSGASHNFFLILIIKPTRCVNSQIYFSNRTLHVSDRFSVHRQDSSTVHTAIGIYHTGFEDYLIE
jgi:hypothetical protein